MKKTKKLADLENGEYARLVNIENNIRLKDKLKAKNIKEGSLLRIISNSGCIIFEIQDKIFAIGKGYAKNIQVRKLIN